MNGYNPNTLRITVAGAPQMLREVLVGIVRSQKDMELVGETADVNDLFRPSHGVRVDVAIVIAGAEEARGIREMVLRKFPALKVILILHNGQDAELYELRPRTKRLGQMSPKELVAAIRSSMREPFRPELPSRDGPMGKAK